MRIIIRLMGIYYPEYLDGNSSVWSMPRKQSIYVFIYFFKRFTWSDDGHTRTSKLLSCNRKLKKKKGTRLFLIAI